MGKPAIDISKHEARQRLKAARKAIPATVRAAADEAICEHVISLPEYAASGLVLTYLSFGSEVNTHPLIEHAWAAGRMVAIPWCVPNTREMRWFRFDRHTELTRSPLGVMEPNPAVSTQVDPASISHALAVVPGLTFDSAGHRLGYGGGFYDTFLSEFDGFSLGLCREAQLSSSLEIAGLVDIHDQCVDVVISESGTIPRI